MIVDKPYQECPDDPIGPLLRRVLLTAHASCVRSNDHYPLLLLGPTNSGKSNLGLWVYEVVHPLPTIWRVVWTKGEFAKAQARVAREEMPRFLMYDELDAESKEAMTGWNRQFKRLFDKVRFSNIFWVLVNPSANYIDKSLIMDEVIKGVLVIRDKLLSRPRQVVFYTQDDLVRMLGDGLPLTLANLRTKKVYRKYGFLLSWFREYTGVLRAEYDEKKASRTLDIHDMFAQEYGVSGEYVSGSKAAKLLGISLTSMKKYAMQGEERGAFRVRTATGHYRFGPDDLKVLRKLSQEGQRGRGIKFGE